MSEGPTDPSSSDESSFASDLDWSQARERAKDTEAERMMGKFEGQVKDYMQQSINQGLSFN